MMKKIPIDQIRIGMYVYDLNLAWENHPFAWQCFLIEDEHTLSLIQNSGAREIEIDPEQGADIKIDEHIENSPANFLNEPSSSAPSLLSSYSDLKRFQHAEKLYADTNKLMQNIMSDVRMGKHVDLEQCDPVVDNILDSMFAFPSTFLPLAQMKTRDEYTFQHSVAVSALAVSFGRILKMPREEIKELSLGGLLHDIGKATTPDHILNKPGKLDDAEFRIMKNHVVASAELIKSMHGVSDIALTAAAQHHERYDGSGYPLGLKGDQISLHGQMLAIVDVYDAITSLRVYHTPTPPAEALRKLYQWSGAHFNPRLIQAFIKGIGIYPAGSLVRLESDKLGIVREVSTDRILQPIVQLIYDCKKSCHILPELIDLSASNDKIRSHESFESWGIDQSTWIAANA
jgi:putative nucleotidyltransferase with HDIG domain